VIGLSKPYAARNPGKSRTINPGIYSRSGRKKIVMAMPETFTEPKLYALLRVT
jgi:hypothetical protein